MSVALNFLFNFVEKSVVSRLGRQNKVCIQNVQQKHPILLAHENYRRMHTEDYTPHCDANPEEVQGHFFKFVNFNAV